MTRVIRNPADASKDYQLPVVRARELYDEGKLFWDQTNGCYTSFRWSDEVQGDLIK